MSARNILAAESDRNLRQALNAAISRLGHTVAVAGDCEEAMKIVGREAFDLAFVDLRLLRGGGLRLLKEIKRLRPETPVVVMSAGGGLDEAVAAMREGAQDYLVKPFPAGVVDEAIFRVLSRGLDETRPGAPEAGSAPEPLERPIVSQSVIMERLLRLAASMAASDATVLLEGESGTGKELLARFIHANSKRKDGPFVAVNCAGLPESLLESELFGHEKGAFTGALARKPGKFDLASGGTILLDEITEMDMSLQAKLLRVLQEGEVDPVGGRGPHKTDVRVIATTNRRLKGWVEEGKFRADLYYRLNVMPFFIPALRDRKEDIEPLARFFVEKCARSSQRQVTAIDPEAMEELKRHDWPGNIRELENTIARAVLMAGGSRIEKSDVFMDESGFVRALEVSAQRRELEAAGAPAALEAASAKAASASSLGVLPGAPAPAAGPGALSAPLPEAGGRAEAAFGAPGAPGPAMDSSELFSEHSIMTIDEMERRLIGRALSRTSGNRTHAARLLGISVRTLRNKLNEYMSSADSEAAAGGA
jgi:two-component system response regulator FlrC